MTEVLVYKIQCINDSKITSNEKKNKCKPLNHDEIISSLNKKRIESIVQKAPKRGKSILKEFIQYLKKETKVLNEFGKAYCLYFWIHKNISFGNCNIKERNFNNIYKQEKLNFLFNEIYSHILKNIGINAFNING